VLKITLHRKPKVAPTRRPRLVIADDDPSVRAVLASQLEAKFECVGAAVDAPTAVALVAEQHPDVVILDVNMPGGGAVHATREIRKHSPDTAIVALSVDEVWADLIDLLNAGAMTYLRKGIDKQTLTRDLMSAIEAHRRSSERSELGTGGPAPVARRAAAR
jgi:DNA-binding NarL/FixJ family response regulator